MTQFPIYVADAGGMFGGMPGDADIGIGHSPELNNLANRLREQSDWNMWAARAAAAAAIVQAISAGVKIAQIAGQH